MEEEATQPCKDPSFLPSAYPPPPPTPSFVFSSLTDDPYYEATQRNEEPQSLDNGNSGLTDEDAADIVCILHPDSDAARIACSENNRMNPKNTIGLEGDTNDVTTKGLLPCDLAVRLSANLKDLHLGWVFGRSHERCDFVLRGIENRVSNQHFRIYFNEHNTLMVEDMSTNGVSIDGNILRQKRKDEGKPYRQTIDNGSLFGIALSKNQEENLHFIIRIPQRNDEAQEAFDKNFVRFMSRLQEAQIQRDSKISGNRQPLNLFPNAANRGAGTSSMVRKRREWRGGLKYNKINTIGKGAFAIVYRVTDKQTGVPFAAKELEKKKLMKNSAVQKVDTEMKIMSKISHDHIVRFIEYVDWDEFIYIIMELVPGGDLTGLVTQCRWLPEDTVKTMTVQLLDALKYLHGLNITHRDIKPDNILCETRDPIHVKLTDFGLSKMIDTEETFLNTFCGTLLYCAPEVYNEYQQYDGNGRRTRPRHGSAISRQRYDHAVDIWSLAGVLFYSFCGNPPFPIGGTTHHAQLLQKIMTTALDVRPLQRVGVSENGVRFVIKMLHTDPEHRATIEDLEQSPWLTGNNPDPDETEDEDVGELEVPASQLSLVGPDVDSDGEGGDLSGCDIVDLRPREIPSSFSSNGSVEDEPFELASSIPSNLGANTSGAVKHPNRRKSYEIIQNPQNDGRLFGEVAEESSVLGNYDALQFNAVSLPNSIERDIQINLPRQPAQRIRTKQHAYQNRLEPVSAMPNTPVPALPISPPPIATPVTRHDNNRVAQTPSSLMGAVSQLGQLKMNSSSMSASELSAFELPSPSYAQAVSGSLRRPREVSWFPNDLPSQKRRKSSRTIHMMVPPETFWDPKDPSTHHRNYPSMSTTDYERFAKLAESKGEMFQHGCTTFDHAMVSFRSSVELSGSSRAQSEPLVEETRNHPSFARDERRLSDDASIQQNIASRESLFVINSNAATQVAQDMGPASTTTTKSTNDNAPVISTIEDSAGGTSASRNDFQVPNRVLAKFTATHDSYVPTIAFNVTEPFTSWGRGYGNTIKYSTRNDLRVGVPRYAFKLFLFKNGFYPSDGKYTEEWNKSNGDERGFRSLISTKSSSGLLINGAKLPSHNANDPLSASKYWGEIRNGDIITINAATEVLLKLKFECFWGMGKYKRKDSKFFLYKEVDHIATIDQACTNLETAAIEKRSEDAVEQEKLALELKRQRTESVGL